MSDKQEDILRDWLEGRHSGLGLDKEVLEAVFVLSPKRSPLPNKTIGHVFSGLRGGPLALLPEESSSEDVEFLFSGAKHHDVLPQGSVDALLNSLHEGPLAGQRANVESLHEHRTSPEDSKSQDIVFWSRSWSMWGTICAAAAVFLVLVQPILTTDTVMVSQEDQFENFSPKIVAPQVEEQRESEEEAEAEVLDSVESQSAMPTVSRKDASYEAPSPIQKKERKRRAVSSSPQKKSKVVQEDSSVNEEGMGPDNEMEAEGALNVLSFLRHEALQGKEIPRHPPFVHLDREALLLITQDTDVQHMYWAAYELALRYPQEVEHIASLLRLKGEDSLYRKVLWVLLGDVYRNAGEGAKAQEAYRQAVQIKE